MSKKVEDRLAVPLADGRVDHRAHVTAGGTTVPWSCVCSPDDKHDHDAAHQMLVDRLEERGKIIESLHALVGKARRVGLVRYTITDCNIQIHGPGKFVLYVAWDEEPVTGGSRHHVETYPWHGRVKGLQTAEEVLAAIESIVAQNGVTLARAVRQAGEFASK